MNRNKAMAANFDDAVSFVVSVSWSADLTPKQKERNTPDVRGFEDGKYDANYT